jgi:hypothetical protein
MFWRKSEPHGTQTFNYEGGTDALVPVYGLLRKVLGLEVGEDFIADDWIHVLESLSVEKLLFPEITG